MSQQATEAVGKRDARTASEVRVILLEAAAHFAKAAIERDDVAMLDGATRAFHEAMAAI